MNFDQPKIMGVLNATPDSFSDGGVFDSMTNAKLRIANLIEEGADIIDIGGESTGPGSKEVSEKEELDRITPIIDHIAENNLMDKVLFSIDTHKSEVAEYALQNGFQIVNDVTALRGDKAMLGVLMKYQPYVVLMYSKDNTARTTTNDIEYEDVIQTIKDFLKKQIDILLEAGFPKEKIIIDPGMGMFVSANPKYSFEIIERLSELKELGWPILIGVSRKSFLGGELEERDKPSAEWSLKAIKNGASIVRMHSVGFIKKS